MMTRQSKHLQKLAKVEKEEEITPQIKKVDDPIIEKFQAYLGLHAQTLFSSLGRLAQTPFTSTMTITVLAISIALASCFYVLLGNVKQLTGNLEASNQISLFLKGNISDLEGRKLADKIKLSINVKSVDLITQDSALAEFRDYSGFGSALNALATNPLPTVIQVLPKNTLESSEELQRFVDELGRLDEVDVSQMDMQWLQRLLSIMDLAQQGVFLLSCVLSFAVLFITGNTIRLELEDRRDEVLIAKLVGATHAFIQRPFLYIGFWYGFFAGMIAWLMVTVIMWVLKTPMENLSKLYDNNYNVLFLTLSESLILVSIASLLGVLGAWIVLRYQLKQMKLE
ncbi:MAG: permease-like cell division protein FtsX [Methylococcales bacterium]|nr:permease-like cell division protein FtsX [Methylococcales bacterium]